MNCISILDMIYRHRLPTDEKVLAAPGKALRKEFMRNAVLERERKLNKL